MANYYKNIFNSVCILIIVQNCHIDHQSRYSRPMNSFLTECRAVERQSLELSEHGADSNVIHHTRILELVKQQEVSNPKIHIDLTKIHKSISAAYLIYRVGSQKLSVGLNLSISQVIKTNVKFEDVVAGKYEIVLAHPEAILCTTFGDRLLSNREFVRRVTCVVVDECHTVNQWSGSFREAFGQLYTLPSILRCPVIALSATLTQKMLDDLPKILGLNKPAIFRTSPDNPNVFFEIRKKLSNLKCFETQEFVFERELDLLEQKGCNYPVTLLYMPLDWIANAQAEAIRRYGQPNLSTVNYGVLFSKQDEQVKSVIYDQLKLNNPRIRLVMCTGTIGMGFDSPCISRVIHGRPPRSMIDLLQQVGRAGRKGQPAQSVLYFNPSDIGGNIPMENEVRELFGDSCQCVRKYILGVFGFQKNDALFTSECRCCSKCRALCGCRDCRIED